MRNFRWVILSFGLMGAAFCVPVLAQPAIQVTGEVIALFNSVADIEAGDRATQARKGQEQALPGELDDEPSTPAPPASAPSSTLGPCYVGKGLGTLTGEAKTRPRKPDGSC